MLDRMGCVVEASGAERHTLLVKDYLKAAEEGKSALIIAPTHSEGDKLTTELRTTLKERGALGKEKQFTSWRSTGWSEAQKADARNYEPGMVLEFNEAIAGTRRRKGGIRETIGGFKKGEAVAVLGREDGALNVLRQDGTRGIVSMESSGRINAFRPQRIGIAKGDRIRITKNGEPKVNGQEKGTPLNNGDIFTVEGFTKEGDIRVETPLIRLKKSEIIRLEKGKLLPKAWAHMTLGYVDTSYSSQGKTVDRVFIAAGDESMPATNQQQWYVSASRGREQAKLYVDSKEDVRNAIARTGQRLSAVELTHTRLRSSWHHGFYKSLSQNRVSRFLSQRVTARAGTSSS